MNISALNTYFLHNYSARHSQIDSNKSANIHFTSGMNMKSLDFNFNDFFIKIRGYGRNEKWAEEIIRTADNAVWSINSKLPAESILISIADGVKRANEYTLDLCKKSLTGILRAQRPGWNAHPDLYSKKLTTRYNGPGTGRYRVYQQRFDEVLTHPLENPYFDFELTRIGHSDNKKYLCHPSSIYINRTLNMINTKYHALISKYPDRKISSSEVENFNSIMAEFKWILSHSTPWARGSDAISNVFIRSLYKAFGIKTSPLKRNISLDLEAYCTNLTDYKKNFPNYFEASPKII